MVEEETLHFFVFRTPRMISFVTITGRLVGVRRCHREWNVPHSRYGDCEYWKKISPVRFVINTDALLITMSAAPKFDESFADRLRNGDEQAFSTLLDTYHGALFRLAISLGASSASAEEIVQETWMAVIDGIDDFEGRSTLKTWIFSILTNQARRRAARDRRMPPLSSIFSEKAVKKVVENQENPCPRSAPTRSFSWSVNPEDRADQRALLEVVQKAVDGLPASQRTVLILRDFEGVEPDEACQILDITDGNHRVLLHRARIRLREAVDQYFERIEDEGGQ